MNKLPPFCKKYSYNIKIFNEIEVYSKIVANGYYPRINLSKTLPMIAVVRAMKDWKRGLS